MEQQIELILKKLEMLDEIKETVINFENRLTLINERANSEFDVVNKRITDIEASQNFISNCFSGEKVKRLSLSVTVFSKTDEEPSTSLGGEIGDGLGSPAKFTSLLG